MNNVRVLKLICLLIILSGGLLFAGGDQEEGKDGGSSAAESAVMVDDMKVDAAVEGDNLVITVSAPTSGWIAVGFKPTSMMKDANILIGYVSGNDVVVEDHFGVNNFGHKPDVDLGGSRDVAVRGGSDDGTTTEITFAIPLSSGDQYDAELSAGEEVKIICAYGGSDDLSKKHRYRSSTTLLIE